MEAPSGFEDEDYSREEAMVELIEREAAAASVELTRQARRLQYLDWWRLLIGGPQTESRFLNDMRFAGSYDDRASWMSSQAMAMELNAAIRNRALFPGIRSIRVIWQAWESRKPWNALKFQLSSVPAALQVARLSVISIKWRMPFRSHNRIQIPDDQVHTIEELESRIQWIQSTLQSLDQADESLRYELRSMLDKMDHRISYFERQVDIVTNGVESLKQYLGNNRWIDQTVLELLRDEIPRYLAIAKDPVTGAIRIPAEFWNGARELFVSKEQMENKVKDEQMAHKANAWDTFLMENEQALREFVDRRMARVSRDEFLDLAVSEAKSIWAGIEKMVVERLEQEGKLKKTGSAERHFRSPRATTSHRGLTLQQHEVILELIDKALEKRSTDVLAKPDYALYNSGGRILPKLTFTDYYQHIMKPTFLDYIGLSHLFPHSSLERLAERALQPSVQPGDCWAMNGTQGQIGIRLARKIIVTEVTIEHIDPQLSLDQGSAPRSMEIWRLSFLPGDTTPSQRNGEGKHSSDDTGDDQAHQGQHARHSSPIIGTWRKEESPMSGSSLLTEIEYQSQEYGQEQGQGQGQGQRQELHNQPRESLSSKRRQQLKLAQTFPIPVLKHNVPSSGVVVRVASNWGHPKFTCLYRVRVHGYEPI
ncbi:hypothetical protein BG011_009188 [Mortierella polycephala]|uniref:SUN domain-containing protein n=1 Tax=Mortierella polycephala TaxID=41804 RepID=A0A9P6QDH3_9FUNG|nr:hypothetical protein BG011_009188 [Mortierella polycephala]